jgi:hypothetical protein
MLERDSSLVPGHAGFRSRWNEIPISFPDMRDSDPAGANGRVDSSARRSAPRAAGDSRKLHRAISQFGLSAEPFDITLITERAEEPISSDR